MKNNIDNIYLLNLLCFSLLLELINYNRFDIEYQNIRHKLSRVILWIVCTPLWIISFNMCREIIKTKIDIDYQLTAYIIEVLAVLHIMYLSLY